MARNSDYTIFSSLKYKRAFGQAARAISVRHKESPKQLLDVLKQKGYLAYAAKQYGEYVKGVRPRRSPYFGLAEEDVRGFRKQIVEDRKFRKL